MMDGKESSMKKPNIKLLGLIYIIVLGLLMTPLPIAAGDFDGSNPLICAAIDAVECVPGGSCQERTLQEINIPRFLHIDFKNEKITGSGGGDLHTRIERTESVQGMTFLQGAEEGTAGAKDSIGWTLAISEDSGEAVISISGHQVGFIVFCNCTPK
jgi:hypothetical protein